MKKFYLPLLMAISFLMSGLLCNAQGVTTPRNFSYGAELSQTIGLAKVIINYSRPRVTIRGNNRAGKIWGQQVPYGLTKITFGGQGEIPWRAGANENTTIEFTDDVKVNGKSMKAGKYGLHIIVNDDKSATWIFSNNSTSWGSFFYREEDDALRIDVQTSNIPHTEVLTYEFIEMGNDYGVLALDWEKKRIPFKIEVDLHKTVLANIRNELRSLQGFGWQGYLSAANYCLTNNINHEEAIKWADQSITSTKNFNNLSVKARLLLQTGNKSAAFNISDEAAQLATINQLNNMAYQLIGQSEIDKAIEYFKLNVKRNPKDPNVHDSMGEAYKTKGMNKEAIKMFRKALSLNPPANVKANSVKLLKELGIEVAEDI